MRFLDPPTAGVKGIVLACAVVAGVFILPVIILGAYLLGLGR